MVIGCSFRPGDADPRAQGRTAMPQLELDGLTRRYGSLTALDQLSFSVSPGHVTGFLGPNGAGKTTTMRAVFGLTALDAGTIRWDGAPVRHTAAASVRLPAGGTRSLPRNADRRAGRVLRAAARDERGRRGGRRQGVAGAAGAGRPGRGQGRDAVAGQPAAGPARGRAGVRPGPAHSRRAAVRSRPGRHRRDVRGAHRPGSGAASACCSPATSSTWWRTSASRW